MNTNHFILTIMTCIKHSHDICECDHVSVAIFLTFSLHNNISFFFFIWIEFIMFWTNLNYESDNSLWDNGKVRNEFDMNCCSAVENLSIKNKFLTHSKCNELFFELNWMKILKFFTFHYYQIKNCKIFKHFLFYEKWTLKFDW